MSPKLKSSLMVIHPKVRAFHLFPPVESADTSRDSLPQLRSDPSSPVESAGTSRNGPPQLQLDSSLPGNFFWELSKCPMFETP